MCVYACMHAHVCAGDQGVSVRVCMSVCARFLCGWLCARACVAVCAVVCSCAWMCVVVCVAVHDCLWLSVVKHVCVCACVKDRCPLTIEKQSFVRCCVCLSFVSSQFECIILRVRACVCLSQWCVCVAVVGC